MGQKCFSELATSARVLLSKRLVLFTQWVKMFRPKIGFYPIGKGWLGERSCTVEGVFGTIHTIGKKFQAYDWVLSNG